MKIIKTKPGDINFHLFQNLPGKLYKTNGNNGLQENISKEFLLGCYVLLVNDKPVARAVLYKNEQLYYKEMRTACIGNYESIDDIEVCGKLINFIISEAKKNNTEFLIGPMNGSTWDNYRFSTHNHYPNFLLEPYHHLYYNEHFLNNGFHVIAEYTSSIDNVLHFDHPSILKKEDEFAKAGVTIRNIDMSNYEDELRKLYPFISSAFKDNFLYTPVSWETFRDKYLEAAKIINPDYVLLAHDKHDAIIGFIFSYDALLTDGPKTLVVKTVARDKMQQWQGLGHVLGNRVVRLAKNNGYQSMIHAFVIEQGTSTGLSTSFLGEVYKNYALYGIKI